MNWRNNNLIVNRPIDINKIGNNWQHNPSHRHGVKYNNADVRQKFARTDAQAGKGARQDFRGRSGQQVLDPGRGAAGDRPGAGDRAKAGDRPGAGDRAKAGDRPGAGDRGKAGDRSKVGAGKGGGKPAASRPSRPSGASARQRDTAFSGADSGRAARSHADRGRQSLAGHGGAGRVAAGGGGPRVGGGGGGFRGGGGGFRGGGGRRSDVALKHDIMLLGHLDNGLGFYRFSYAGSRKAYVGVMAQEVQAVVPDAVVRGADGYLRVRYEKLGIQFQTYERWKASGARIPAGIRLPLKRFPEHEVSEDVMITLPAFLRPVSSVRPLVCLAAAAGLMMFATCAVAQVRYSNPDEAMTALITAAKAADPRGLARVLGPAAARSCPPAIRSPMRRRASASSRATRPGTRW